MQNISKEILENYGIRKTRAQKSRFIDFMKNRHPDIAVEEGGFLGSRNLVIGDPKSASLILTAHYDTCATLPVPNFLAPNNLLVTLLYGVVLAIPILAVMLAASILMSLLELGFWPMYFINIVLFIGLFIGIFFAGRPNPRNFNDNTSGIITLLELLETMDEAERAKCCFVFFDNEENGLLGSAFFFKKHKEEVKNTPLINFDCVSDGEHLLLVPSKAAKKRYGEKLSAAFCTDGTDMQLHMGGAFTQYPSDQAHFPLGIGAACFRKAPLIGLYIARIHTKRDTVFEERNIQHLVAGTKRFIASL